MFDQFTSSIVGILTLDGSIIGSGFLISKNHVLTCAHVVAQASGIPTNTLSSPESTVSLYFPWITSEENAAPKSLNSHVVFWRPISNPQNSRTDIAILELDSDPPENSQIGRLAAVNDLWGLYGHPFKAFGFPCGSNKCVVAKGVIRDMLPNGHVVIEDINTIGFPVSPGFSGAPVWDNQVNGIVGMIVAAEAYSDIRTAYMIPINQLTEVFPELNQHTFTRRKEILIDNFTIQGAYCYLFEGARGNIYMNCLSNLIESVVLYDGVKRPQDISNYATRFVTELLNGTITGCRIPADKKSFLHFLSYADMGTTCEHPSREHLVIKTFYEILKENPFAQFEKEKDDLLAIDDIGQLNETLKWINPSLLINKLIDFQKLTCTKKFPFKKGESKSDTATIYLKDIYRSFQFIHFRYTLYCMELAWNRGINYLPNPTRIPIINNFNFNRKIFIPGIRQMILGKLEQVRKKHIEKIHDFFNLKTLTLKMPVLLNHILATAGYNGTEIIKYTLELRNSRRAKAYRKWASRIESAIESEDVAFLSKEIEELEDILAQWSKSLRWEGISKVTINAYPSFDFKIGTHTALAKNHLVFLHQLLY